MEEIKVQCRLRQASTGSASAVIATPASTGFNRLSLRGNCNLYFLRLVAELVEATGLPYLPNWV